MTGLFAHKQICCEHCGFGFFFTGFSSAAKIVCPACGEENVLSLPPEPATLPPAPDPEPEVLPVLLHPPAEKPALCSVEHCPLLTGGEPDNAVAERLGLRLQKRQKRRRTILAWTVTLQVCVLLGVALFLAKMPLLSEEDAITLPPIAHVDTPASTNTPPELLAVHSVEPDKTAVEPPVPEPVVSLPEYTAPPPVYADPPPVYVAPPVYADVPPFLEMPADLPEMAAAIPEYVPDPIPAEPLPTLALANELLESAKTTLAVDQKQSMRQALRAAEIYEQLGVPLPDSMYWILANAFALQSWGEPLLESSPVIETMTLSPDNRYLLAQLRDKTVWLWDLRSSESERSGCLLEHGAAEYVKFVFSPDLRWIIGGQKNGTIRIWDRSLPNPAETLFTFTERVPNLQDLQISPNGHWLAAFGHSPQSTPITGKLQPSQPVQQTSTQRPERSGQLEVSYPVLVWNLRQIEPGVVPGAITIPGIPQPVQVVRFSPHSDRLAIGSKNAVVWVYDLTVKGVGDEPFILQGHQLGVTQIAFAPNGEWLATGSQDNTVCLWSLSGSRSAPESAMLYGHIGWISALTIDAAGEYLFSGSYDRTIRIWNVKRDRITSALNERPIILETSLGVPESLSITRDGGKMIVLGNEGSLGIYHLPSLLADVPGDYFRAVTFRNSRLSISKCLLTSDDQFLIFSYDHLANPSNNGIRLWALQPQPFVR